MILPGTADPVNPVEFTITGKQVNPIHIGENGNGNDKRLELIRGGGKLSHATQNLVKSACVLTIITHHDNCFNSTYFFLILTNK